MNKTPRTPLLDRFKAVIEEQKAHDEMVISQFQRKVVDSSHLKDDKDVEIYEYAYGNSMANEDELADMLEVHSYEVEDTMHNRLGLVLCCQCGAYDNEENADLVDGDWVCDDCTE